MGFASISLSHATQDSRGRIVGIRSVMPQLSPSNQGNLRTHDALEFVGNMLYISYIYCEKMEAQVTGIASKIMMRVRGHGRGHMVFTWKDFQDFGARGSVDQALARLANACKLRRVARGMYDLPRTSKLLRGPAPANADAVIDAVQRHDGVTIKPDDIAAANALGLTTAVPVQPRYRTSGGRRTIKVGNQTIKLRPAGRKLDAWLDTPASVPMQALLFLGEKSADDPAIVSALRNRLSSDAKRALMDDCRYRPDWMRSVIEKIVNDGQPQST